MKKWSRRKTRSIAPLRITRSRLLNWTAALLACGALLGCSSDPAPPVTSVQVAPSSPVVSSESQVLPPSQIAAAVGAKPPGSYILGPDDIISISVYLHPELSSATSGTEALQSTQTGSGAGLGGILVTQEGTVALPLIGDVKVAGMTIEQAQRVIAADYATYIMKPDVTLQLVQAQSLRYYLLGEFTTPGVKYPGHTMTLLDALALGGSVNIGTADLYQAYVADGATKIPVDLHALLVDGDLTENITLNSGATIVIPPSTNENAYVFGAVGKPGPIPFQSGELSLLQALSAAGLDLPNYTSARLARVHIIRAHGRSAEFMVVDAAKIMAGQASIFALLPGDVVFVPPTSVASWNQVLDMLLPSLTTISGALNPYVQIQYLTRKP